MLTQDTRSICQTHHDKWLQHYKPTRCAACPEPLSTATRPCPEWLREKLQAQQGAFVHERPCYKEAVAARKKAQETSSPMEEDKENLASASKFEIDVSLLNTQFMASKQIDRHT